MHRHTSIALRLLALLLCARIAAAFPIYWDEVGGLWDQPGETWDAATPTITGTPPTETPTPGATHTSTATCTGTPPTPTTTRTPTITMTPTPSCSTASAPWWNGSWTKRAHLVCGGINFPAAEIGGGTVTSGFPCRVTLTSGSASHDAVSVSFADFQADHDDLCFVADDQTTVLNHEVEVWNTTETDTVCTAANCATVWVGVPTVATAGTPIWMYYGNAGATDCAGTTPNPQSVWDSNYKGVWHFPNGATLTANDSTATGLDGDLDAGDLLGSHDPATPVSGIADGAAHVGYSGFKYHFIRVPSATAAKIDTVGTISAWAYITTLPSGWQKLLVYPYHDYWSAPYFSYQLAITADNKWNVGFSVTSTYTDGLTAASAVDPNTWVYVTGTFNNGVIKAWINGSLVTTNDISAKGTSIIYSTGSRVVFGANDNELVSNEPLYGHIDEARIAFVERSAAWIKAEYDTTRGAFIRQCADSGTPIPTITGTPPTTTPTPPTTPTPTATPTVTQTETPRDTPTPAGTPTTVPTRTPVPPGTPGLAGTPSYNRVTGWTKTSPLVTGYPLITIDNEQASFRDLSAVRTGEAVGKALCTTADGHLGYCSDGVSSGDGSCTCN